MPPSKKERKNLPKRLAEISRRISNFEIRLNQAMIVIADVIHVVKVLYDKGIITREEVEKCREANEAKVSRQVRAGG